MNIKTIAEVAALGGKASWEGVSAKERSRRMSILAKRPRKKRKKVIHIADLRVRK